MQNGQTPQYPNENRKKRNKASVVFAVCVISAVALAAAAILVTMSLVTMPDRPSDPDAPVTSALPSDEVSSSTASETGSMTVSVVEPEENSSKTESKENNESSVVSDIELEGTTGEFVQSDDRLLVVVNNEVDLPESFKANLTEEYDATIDKSMVDAWEQLYDAGSKEGHYFWITYSYRTVKEQNSYYNSNVKSLMESGLSKKQAQAKADVTVQKGGDSEYITGLSIGVNTANDAFGETSDYKWLVENGPDYGFILRFPEGKEKITGMEYQPWRFRYVGKTHAKQMQKLNMCLEEYVQYLNDKETKKEAADKAEVITDTSADTTSKE